MADTSDPSQAKHPAVRFDEIPQVLVQAVLSAEDKHFFHHPGIDPLRVLKAAYVNIRSGRKAQGASTITMQLSRILLLDSTKSWSRKAMELLITIMLEQKLTKKEIFEHYCNHVFLGFHENIRVRGFKQAARLYFDKNVDHLAFEEAALLAGILQRPAYFDPFKYSQRAVARRNLVIRLMRLNGYISSEREKTLAELPAGLVAMPQSSTPPTLAHSRCAAR